MVTLMTMMIMMKMIDDHDGGALFKMNMMPRIDQFQFVSMNNRHSVI